MFKIYDGREEFYQWDLNQKLIVSDASINEVHFCNRTDECSLVCEVYEEDGARLVDVPNILFQATWDIRAYAYCTDHTLTEKRFKVKARTRPADYVYTETGHWEVRGVVQEVVDEAIASGELTGEKGEKGDPGEPGKDGEPGAPGKDGKSGVYIGTTEPTDDSTVWINPEGEATGAGVTMEEVEAKGYQTEAQVTALINDALGVIENGSY